MTRLEAFAAQLACEVIASYRYNDSVAAAAVAERMVRDFALDYHFGEGRRQAEMAAWMDEPEPTEKP
jgi:hypothetical protein